MENKTKINFLNALTLVTVVCTFIYFTYVTFLYVNGKLPDNSYISQILTTIIAIVLMIFNYHFGSSKSSKDKDETIKTMQSDNKDKITVDTVNTDNIETVNTKTVNNS